MRDLVSGAISMGYLVSGLFFLRFWTRTHDRLFAIFAGAFWLLALQRVLLVAFAADERLHVPLYVVRLLGFVLILVAIIDKNRPQGSGVGGRGSGN